MREGFIQYYDDIESGKSPRVGDTSWGRYIQTGKESSIIQLARDWLKSNLNKADPDSNSKCPTTETSVKIQFGEQVEPNKNDWTNPTDPDTDQIIYPLKNLNSSFKEWETHLCITSDNYSIRTDLPPQKWAQANASNVYRSKIKISAYCICMAVVRAAIMH